MRILSALVLCAAMAMTPVFCQLPRPSPDYSVQLPGGKTLPLRTLHGKIVALVFIDTT